MDKNRQHQKTSARPTGDAQSTQMGSHRSVQHQAETTAEAAHAPASGSSRTEGMGSAGSSQAAPGGTAQGGGADLGRQGGGLASEQGMGAGSEQVADDVGNQRYSNDSAEGLPRAPAGSRQSAETDMDDDTGLSNSRNRQAPVDQRANQAQQSNVGRRDDLTPD